MITQKSQKNNGIYSGKPVNKCKDLNADKQIQTIFTLLIKIKVTSSITMSVYINILYCDTNYRAHDDAFWAKGPLSLVHKSF